MSDLDRAVVALADALPRGRVSVADADRLAVSTDLWPRHLIRMAQGERVQLPAAVVWPESTDELAATVLAARRHRIGLVAYGAGSSVVGGATPHERQVVVDFKRMARLLELDAAQGTATAQTGIMGELLERQLARRGFTQGHFPSSIYCSTMGGWIAARSAGQMSSRYGKIEDQVVGGILVLGDGRVLRHHPSVVRDAAFDALVGAEGSLALWSEATVRIHPLPERRKWRAFTFPTLADAVAVMQEWLGAGISPAVVRVYDALDTWLHRLTHSSHAQRDRGPNALAWVGANLPRLSSAVGDLLAGGLQCVVGVQGDQRQVDLEMELVLELARRGGARDLGPEPGEAWYEHRYALSYAQSRTFRAGVAVDTMEVACTWDRIVPTYEAVRAAALAAGAQVLAHFSHVYLEGGSIYFTYALPMARGVEGYDKLWRDCLGAASRAGANVSHHHGTGKLKAGALAAALGGARDAWLRMQKELDPDRVLNPTLLARPEGSSVVASEPRDAVGEMATARPDETLSAVEHRLGAEGATLGPVGVLLGTMSVGEAARRRWLWRYDTQVRVIESLVLGVDGHVGGQQHRFTPAPRAAMGPDLTAALLEEDVERVWLRTVRERPRCVRFVGETRELLKRVAAIAAHEAGGAAMVSVTAGSDRGVAHAWLPEGQRGDLARDVIAEIVGDVEEGSADPVALGGEPLFVAGRWAAIRRVCAALDDGVQVTLFAADALGAAGFVHPENLDEDRRARLRAHAVELGAIPEAVVEAAGELPASGAPVVVARRGRAPAALALRDRIGALDNCTYCPKLCRFACPVSVADGNEALLPRQLMLTANLHRRGTRPLSVDGAARLWSCVDCRSCRTFCDHGNDVAGTLAEARAELLAAGGGPPEVRAYLAVLARSGRPPDRPHADDVALAVDGDGARSSTWLFLGCQGAREDPEPARAALELARRHYGQVHVMRAALSCCGGPLYRWGDHAGFERYARAFARQLGTARRLVVDDACCAYALSVLYERAGVRMPAIVTTTSLLRRERWQPARREKWAVHDSAFALRWMNEPSLATLPALAALDLPPGSVVAGEGGSCGSMLLPIYDDGLAEKVARNCVHDLLGGGAQRILVASPSCRRRLRSTGAPVDDVFELWRDSGG